MIASLSAFSQVKKATTTVKQNFVDYSEYITDFKSRSYVKNHLLKFPTGKEFDKNTIPEEEPAVEYHEDAGMYRYVYKTDNANFIVYVKNGLTISKNIILYNINDFMYLINYFDLYNKEFVSGKGFKINDAEYLMVSKSRHYDYDSFKFSIHGLEFFNVVDLLNSKENGQK
ncbi:hypothetical protein BPO_0034 [Bergeyella porcorum]|uniref:Uncharacterized protein n=2 Tax=Bergeyella porcorum TaxID=1735111 RepID=A0AAU0EZJ6_9FLAO